MYTEIKIMTKDEPYNRQILSDLAGGDIDPLEELVSAVPEQDYQNLDDFTQCSSANEQQQLVGDSLHPNHIPSSEREPELKKAIAQIKLNEHHDVAHEFLKQLEGMGISDRDLEEQLNLSSCHANHMNANDVSQLAAFTYHNHPEIFQNVVAEKPGIVKFLSNSLVGAILGAIAIKWLGNRRY
jgi:exopolyphosphatase/pppGpp-phosphohydrolase